MYWSIFLIEERTSLETKYHSKCHGKGQGLVHMHLLVCHSLRTDPLTTPHAPLRVYYMLLKGSELIFEKQLLVAYSKIKMDYHIHYMRASQWTHK